MDVKSIRQYVFFSLLVGTTVATVFILGKFLIPLFWAIVFAIIFNPVHLYFKNKLKGRENWASLSTIMAIFLMVLIPLSIVGSAVAKESIEFYKNISENGEKGGSFLALDWVDSLTEQFAFLGIDDETVTSSIYSGVSNISQNVYSFFISFGQSTFTFFLYLVIMFYLLFFMFRDGEKIKEKLKKYLPLNKDGKDKIIPRFLETTRAVVGGTFVIALVQGILGGVIFWLAGVPSPALWGVVMFILSIIPAFGPFLVWGPVGVISLVSGFVWQGIFVLVSGALLISMIDNILRPILVGRGANIPDPVVLLSTVGGLTYLGVSGFIIGPIVAALTLTLWEMFGEEYSQKK